MKEVLNISVFLYSVVYECFYKLFKDLAHISLLKMSLCFPVYDEFGILTTLLVKEDQ
jgi:hypothetical protein